MSDVNKQLLESLAQIDLAETEMRNAKAWSAGPQAKKHCDFALSAIATARQAIAAAEQAQAEPVAWDSIESVAAGRYKVVPSHESMFYRFAVVAGDGEQQLYLGRKAECENMARKFSGAFLDGAFAYQQITEPAKMPAVAVPDEMESVHDTPFMSADTEPEIAYRDGWNACRAAMLAAAQKGGA